MPSVVGGGAADSDSDFSDSDDAVAPEYDEVRDGRDRRQTKRAPPAAVAPVWPQDSAEPEAAGAAEALLRQKERQLALLQREVLEIKGKLPKLLADERASSFETPTAAAAAPGSAAADGALRCVLCQDPLAGAPKMVNVMRVPSPAPIGPTQCQKCSAVCCAVYCSLAHQKEDDRRHAAECQAIMGDSETREIVEKAKNCRPPVKATRYRCGMSDNHNYEVRRTVGGESVGGGGGGGASAGGSAEQDEDPLAKYIARVDRSAVLGPGPDKQWAVLRGQTIGPSSPEAVAKAAASAPPLAASTPWVSFGSFASVVRLPSIVAPVYSVLLHV